MKDFRQITIFLLFLFLWQTSTGQLSYSFRKYTVDDGLPSSNLYDIIEDNKGFIWISTEAGVCRFDGRTFEKEPIEALGNAEVIKLFFDDRGRMWFTDLGNNILVYENDSLAYINDLPAFKDRAYLSMFEDKNGDYWFYGSFDNSLTLLDGETLADSSALIYTSDNFTPDKTFISFNDSLQIILTQKGVYSFRHRRMEYKAYPEEFGMKRPPQVNVRLKDSIVVATLDQLYLFSRRNHSLTPVFTAFNEMFEGGITVMDVDAEDNLWVGTKDGVVLFPANNRHQPQRYLTNRFISGILQDHEGGYWFATQKDGLFYLPSLRIKTYQNKSVINQLTAVCTDTLGRVLIGFDNSHLNVLNRDYRSIKQWKMHRVNGEIYDLVKDSSENFYVLHSRGLQKLDSDFEPIYRTNGSFKYGKLLNDQLLFYGSTNKAGVLDTDNRSFSSILDLRTYSILPLSENEAWIGTVQGLHHAHNDTVALSRNPALQQDIRDIQIATDSTLWIATQADGLILYKDSKVLQHFTTRNGLVSNNCKKILIDANYAWLGTNKGIHRFNLNDLSFITITKDHGLPSNEINDFAKHENTMLVATNNGLAIFDDSLKIYTAPPRVQFTKVSFKDIESQLNQAYKISYEENDLNIEFSGIAYHQPYELEYQYTLSPLNDNWVLTNANLAQFQELEPGDYTFKVRARTHNSLWSPEQTIRFSIATPFWKQWWFLIGTALIALFLLYILFAWIYNDIRARREISDKLQASQMTALRAQMNPHFLFNSLNSIQEFIINQDKREANRYLTRFSRLMRNILNMSEKEEVYLKQEIETLELYLSLEALRFEENFEYHIETDQSIDTESLTIPPMLVQPYVENAVKHGLMHKKDGMRHLWVRFYVEKKMLVCEVEDNGIGRAKAKAIQENNQRVYKSKGMEMTKQRLQLLNRAYDNTLDEKVEDLVDPVGDAVGTKVTLYISLDE